MLPLPNESESLWLRFNNPSPKKPMSQKGKKKKKVSGVLLMHAAFWLSFWLHATCPMYYSALKICLSGSGREIFAFDSSKENNFLMKKYDVCK